MSNSPLVSYTKISPNKGNWNGYRYIPERTHSIDTITIHCVVGQCSVETLGRIFADPNKKASSNYGVGYDGKIGMYVEEKDRSWCSSNGPNDNRAVTIEVASDTKHPYAVNSKAWDGMINLLVDICKRNGIKELKWKADKSLIGQPNKQNMTVHRWFDNKACPGEYLYSRHYQIAKEVNAKLRNSDKEKPVDVDKKVWDYFKAKGMSDYGIAGLAGNLAAESNLNPKNLQNSFEKNLGYNDETYTKDVDNGSYKNFINDGAGYGLAQWTYYSRKSNLLNYSKIQNKSIGDMDMQLDFIWSELKERKSTLEALNSSPSIRIATNIVMTGYEMPADQSESALFKRMSYATSFYNRFAKKDPTPKPSGKLTVDGVFRADSVKAMQKWVGSEYVDGIISDQLKSMKKYYPGVTSVKYGLGGSYCVKKLQKKIGVNQDGYLGPETSKGLQRFLNKHGFKLNVDGVWGSGTSKAFQTYLNTVVK